MNRVTGSFGETADYLFQTTPVLSGPPRLGSGNEPERTAEIEPTALPLLGVLLEKKKWIVAWALGTASPFSRPSLLYPNRQYVRRVSSLQHILGHVCRFIVQERVKEHSPQEGSSMFFIF